MFSALDLPYRSFTSGRAGLHPLRPLFYGFVPPPEFLCRSVDTFLAEFDGVPYDDTRPEARLVPSRQAIETAGMTPVVADSLRGALRELLPVLPSRERLQVWHCLRALGTPPEDGVDSNGLLAVVFEFVRDGILCLVAVYADASAFSVGSRLVRWSSREEGEPSGWVNSILGDGSLLGTKTAPVADELPDAPHPGEVMVSFLYPAGIRSLKFKEDGVSQTPYGPLFASGLSLWQLLETDAQERPVGFSLDSPDIQYASVFRRLAAFAVDLVIYTLFFLLIGFFTRNAILLWETPGLVSLFAISSLLPPFLAAWMESSPHWGFRTIGKHLLGCRVLCACSGDGPGFLQALARNIAKWFISPLFFLCGFLWAGFHRYRRAWHDVMSDTVVARYDDSEIPELGADSVLIARD